MIWRKEVPYGFIRGEQRLDTPLAGPLGKIFVHMSRAKNLPLEERGKSLFKAAGVRLSGKSANVPNSCRRVKSRLFTGNS